MKKLLGRIVLICLLAGAVSGVILMTINNHVVNSTKESILHIDKGEGELTDEEEKSLKDLKADCILVLGAGIMDHETPTPMLKDRLDTAVKLYKKGIAPKILLTGDNGTEEHNELHVMLNYVLDQDVNRDDVFCDHAGFSTYDSMYRASNIFEVERAVIVTQNYHLYRAVYIADKLGIEAAGAAACQAEYSGQALRELREVAARIKDYFKCMKGSESLLGGEIIPISGSGVISHGE